MAPITSIIRQAAGIARLVNKPDSPYKNSADTFEYFGPGVSVAPIAPAGTEPRGWQYWVNQNMIFTPRPDAAFTAQQLRSLATYPLARIAIENCKDVIVSLPRQIRAVKNPGEKNADVDKRSKNDPVLKMLNQFFDKPNADQDWETWLRAWLEDVYTIDAPSVLVRRMKSRRIRDLRVIDGAFITRLVDENGWTPQPPLPAYQQLWSGTPSTTGGIPFVDLTTQQLVYRPRNIVPRNTVSSFLYGYSPTEQQAQELEIGQQRLNFWLAYYTTGTIPDAIHIVPPNISSDELQKAQKALTSEMSGQPFKRSGFIKLLQGFVDRSQQGASSGDQLIFPKEKLLSDPFDEMHIRKVFYGYGASSQRILKAMNRASAQASQEAAEEEGTQPVANSVRGLVNWIIAEVFALGWRNYELTFDAQKELDVVKRATADKSDVDTGIISRDEARAARGLDPRGGSADELSITTSTAVVPVDFDERLDQQTKITAAMPQKPAPGRSEDDEPVEKRAHIRIDPAESHPHTRQAQAKLESLLARVFAGQRDLAKNAAEKLLKVRFKKSDDPDEKADNIYDAIADTWKSVPGEAKFAIEQAALAGGSSALVALELHDTGLVTHVNTIAQDYARKRAAELVGMKYTEDGELIPNPNAKWAISETTRDRLREIVRNAFEDKTPFSDVIQDIYNADIFSDSRAVMIARTEIANAQVRSNFDTWKASGLVKSAKWLAVGPDPCPICLGNHGHVRELGDKFPDGSVHPTAHPNCYCILQATEFNE